MLMVEFYRQKLRKIEDKIQNAEIEKDFKSVAKLQVKKAEVEKRIKEIENNSL